MRFVSLVALAVATPAFAGGGYVTHVEEKVDVTVANNLDNSICYLYISPVTDSEWGPDQLGTKTLTPGDSDSYSMDKGDWDVKAEDCDHNELWSQRGLSIYNGGTLNIGDPGHVKVVNLAVVNSSSEKTVCYLYISPHDQADWGGDVLESRVLSPGETDKYQMPVGQWDFKAEDCDHNVLTTMTDITIADESVLTLTD